MRKLVALISGAVLAPALLTGCGSSKSSSTASTATVATPTPSVNASIAAQVPGPIKSKGTLTVASEAEYAPNEFIAPDGHTVIGMDPDLVKALGAVMGLKTTVVNSTFEAIIPGLAAGRYDVGASSFTDTKEREKTVDFVTYLSVGQAFLTKANGGPKPNTLADLCGHKVSVEKGTVELEEAVLVGERELVGGHEHHALLAERVQDLLHGDEGPERVAVRVLVGGYEKAVVRAEGFDDRGEIIRLRRAHR